MDVSFRPDPHPDTPFDADLTASMGVVRSLGGRSQLCAHREEGELIQQAHWFVLLLLEWLVCSWERLLHEERLPEPGQGSSHAEFFRRTVAEVPDDELEWQRLARWQEWLLAHSLRAAADGGLFPDVYLRRWGDQIEVSVGAESLPGDQGELTYELHDGVFLAPVAHVARALHEVLRLASAHLVEAQPQSER